MSDDLVKNDVQATRELRKAVERYAEVIRGAASRAKREMAEAERRASEELAARQKRLARAEAELRATLAALAGCRENCGGLQRAVAQAEQRVAETRNLVQLAQRAARTCCDAHGELARALGPVEEKVADTGSLASSALATLEGRIASLDHGHHYVRDAVVTAGLLGSVFTTNGHDIGNALSAAGVSNPLGDPSLSSLQERQEESGKDGVADRLLEARKRSSDDLGKRPKT